MFTNILWPLLGLICNVILLGGLLAAFTLISFGKKVAYRRISVKYARVLWIVVPFSLHALTLWTLIRRTGTTIATFAELLSYGWLAMPISVVTILPIVGYLDWHAGGMIVPVVTGGIASGKSEVCKILKECHGYTVISMDNIYKELLIKDYENGLYQPICNLFGKGVSGVDSEGRETIDTAKLGAELRKHPHRLQELEQMTQPLIVLHGARLLWNRSHLFSLTRDKVIVEMPLLAESQYMRFMVGTIITVEATVSNRSKRHLSRARIEFKEVFERQKTLKGRRGGGAMKNSLDAGQVTAQFQMLNQRQADDEQRQSVANLIIQNNSSVDQLKKSVASMIADIV